MLLAKAILLLTFLAQVNSFYDYSHMSFMEIMGAAVEDAYLQSKSMVERKHEHYLYGSVQRFTQQKLTQNCIEFQFHYFNEEYFTQYLSLICFDLIQWEPKERAFVWETSIQDLLEFATHDH